MFLILSLGSWAGATGSLVPRRHTNSGRLCNGNIRARFCLPCFVQLHVPSSTFDPHFSDQPFDLTFPNPPIHHRLESVEKRYGGGVHPPWFSCIVSRPRSLYCKSLLFRIIRPSHPTAQLPIIFSIYSESSGGSIKRPLMRTSPHGSWNERSHPILSVIN